MRMTRYNLLWNAKIISCHFSKWMYLSINYFCNNNYCVTVMKYNKICMKIWINMTTIIGQIIKNPVKSSLYPVFATRCSEWTPGSAYWPRRSLRFSFLAYSRQAYRRAQMRYISVLGLARSQWLRSIIGQTEGWCQGLSFAFSARRPFLF